MALIGSITSPAISGNTNFDSGTLFVDSVGNAVGVGTTTPTMTNGANLEIANSTVARLVLNQTGTRRFSLGAGSNGFNLYDETADREAFRVMNSSLLKKVGTPNVGQAGFDSQWFNGSKSYGTSSGTWVPLFFCDHSHSLTYNFLVSSPNGPGGGSGSVCGFSSITYGGGNGPTNTQSGVLGGGYITSLSARYNNAGYQIEIQVNGSFGGLAPIVYWQVVGVSPDDFYAL